MAWPLHDLAGDLAVARGGGPVATDPMVRVEGRSLRRRLAALLWIPGATGCAIIWSVTGSPVIGVATFAVLIAALWLFSERGERIWAAIRRRR